VIEICPDQGHGRKNEHFPLAGNRRLTKSIFRAVEGREESFPGLWAEES
jgi:hypothetical protein